MAESEWIDADRRRTIRFWKVRRLCRLLIHDIHLLGLLAQNLHYLRVKT